MGGTAILHVDSGREWRGGQGQVLHLLCGLRERGWRQCLACPPQSELGRRAREAGIAVEAVPMAGEWDWRAPGKLAQLARKHGAALLHVHASLAHGLCWRALRRLPECQLVVTRRVDFAISGNVLSRWKYRHPRTHYIAISSGVRDVLLAGGIPAERIAIVHSGIDAARWSGAYSRADLLREFELPDEALLVVNVAALVDHKGQCYLIDAAAQVLKTFPQAYFFIVGEGELRAKLAQRIAALGIGESVHLVGFREDVEKFLAGADLFVLSSHLEGLCTSLLDAQWFGKAAVGTRAGGIVDVIEPGVNGWLVEAKNPAALAQAMNDALGNPALREQYGQAGRARVERLFSAQAMVEGTVEVYQRLCEKNKRG